MLVLPAGGRPASAIWQSALIVLPLSEHVDYWDYLGWRDPFARAEHTQRQRAYARRLGLSYVYTPQFVIQGMTQAVARDRGSILRLITEAQTSASGGGRAQDRSK